jgi:hypothetical protein
MCGVLGHLKVTAVFITIGPANFFTLMVFISTSVIRPCGRLCGCDASTASRWPDASFTPDPPIEPNRT